MSVRDLLANIGVLGIPRVQRNGAGDVTGLFTSDGKMIYSPYQETAQQKATRLQVLRNSAKLSPLGTNFAAALYRKDGAVSTFANTVSSSRAGAATYPRGGFPIAAYPSNSPRTTTDGQVLEAAGKNYIPDSAFTGAVVGVVGSGGALPSGMDMSAVGGTLTVVSVGIVNGAERMRLKFDWAANAITTGAYMSIRPFGSIGVTPSDTTLATWSNAVAVVANTNVTAVNLLLSERTQANANVTSASSSNYLTDATMNWRSVSAPFTAGNKLIPAIVVQATDLAQAGTITLDIALMQLEPGLNPTSWIRTPSRAPYLNGANIVADQSGTNLMTNPNFTGAAVGVVGAGGALPTGMNLNVAVTQEIISLGVVNGQTTLRMKLSRTGGVPSGQFVSIRPMGSPGKNVASGGIAFSGAVKVVSQTNVSSLALVLQELNAASGNAFVANTTGRNLALNNTLQWDAILRVPTPGNNVLPAYSLTLASAATDFDITLDILIPFLEFGATLPDVMGSRAAETATLKLTQGVSYDVFVQGSAGGDWRNAKLASASGVTLDSGTKGFVIVKEAIAFDAGLLTTQDKTDLSTMLYPPTYDALVNNGAGYADVGLTPVTSAKFRPATRLGSDWSIRKMNNKNSWYRFELRNGDHHFGWGAEQNPYELTVERTEMEGLGAAQNNFKFKCDIWWSFSFFIEEGTSITSAWCVIGQWHNTGDVGDAAQSPPLAFVMTKGDVLQVLTRTDANAITTKNPPEQKLWASPGGIKRGTWHHQVHRVNYDWNANGTGKVDVWLDGEHIVDFAGPIGYNDVQWHFPKFGIYRESAPETIAVHYANHEIAVVDTNAPCSISDRIANPLPIS